MIEVAFLFTKDDVSWFITEGGKNIFICEKRLYQELSQRDREILKSILHNHKFYEHYGEKYYLVEPELKEELMSSSKKPWHYRIIIEACLPHHSKDLIYRYPHYENPFRNDMKPFISIETLDQILKNDRKEIYDEIFEPLTLVN